MIKFEEFKKTLLKDRKTQKEYARTDIAFELGQRLIVARAIRNMTQKKLARLVGTKQPAIARIESGAVEAKNSFLARAAKALGMELTLPQFMYRVEYSEARTATPSQSIKVESEFPAHSSIETKSRSEQQPTNYLCPII